MSVLTSRYNRQRTFNVDTKGLPYARLEELYMSRGAESVYPVRAIYINTKSQFGLSPIIVTDGVIVNLPSWMLNDIQAILADNEAVAEIQRGVIGFKIVQYPHPKYRDNDGKPKMCYRIEYVDING